MPAEVVKLPKVYRQAQRWQAQCDECPMWTPRHPSAMPWRRAGAAQGDADRHNRERHG